MKVNSSLMKMVVGVISVIFLWTTPGAAGFPERPIKVLEGWPAGSMTDLMDRAAAEALSKILKQPVIVENVPGAGGGLVLGRVKSVEPDGYTLFQTGLHVYAFTPWTRTVPYNTLKDFAWLGQLTGMETYLVSLADRPWKNFDEMIQYIQNNPKTVRFSTTGVGTMSHVVMEYIAMKKNLQWIHVPYNSTGEMLNALLGGHTDLATMNPSIELEYVKSGRLRPIIGLNSKRIPVFPDLPTVIEKGIDFSSTTATTWAVPANTPKDIQKILEDSLLKAFQDPLVIDVVKKLNQPYDPKGSEAVTKAVLDDYAKYGEILKRLGLGIFKK